MAFKSFDIYVSILFKFEKRYNSTTMQRRRFVKNTTLCAVAISTTGLIRFDGNKYVGDCETTSDILGPFYRPDSPVRKSLVIPGQPGTPIELSGIIRHKDCVTTFNKAKIELWHCDASGVYDNSSDEYRYRGTGYSDEQGQYSFKTILPVPYDIGDGQFRPAHFHLMITAEGYPPLVTQLYFSGDANISKDAYSSSPEAKNRILEIENLNDGSKKVVYNVSLSEILAAEGAAIDRLVGIYVDEKDKNKKIEFFKKNNQLWMKNEVFGRDFVYNGNNSFEYPGMPPGTYEKLSFNLLATGDVKLMYNFMDDDLVPHSSVYIKAK